MPKRKQVFVCVVCVPREEADKGIEIFVVHTRFATQEMLSILVRTPVNEDITEDGP
jgi:hypothetical protein